MAPRQASPVQSANSRARNFSRLPVTVCWAMTAAMVGPSISRPLARWSVKRSRFGSASARVEFLLIFVEVGGVFWAVVGASFLFEFGDDVADAGIGWFVSCALEPDADLAAVVSAEDGSVLDECDVQPESCGGDGGTGSGDSTTDDDEVVLAGVFGVGWESKHLLAKGTAVPDRCWAV